MPPLLGIRGASSAQSFGLFTSSVMLAGGWIGRFNFSGFTRGLAVDSSDNIYAAILISSNTLIAKISKSGTLLWQKTIPSFNASSLACTTSGDIYIVGQGSQIIQLDTSGTIIWQRILSGIGAGFTEVALDSSGSAYIAGSRSSGGTAGAYYKYSSSGSISFQNQLADNSSELQPAASSFNGTNMFLAISDPNNFGTAPKYNYLNLVAVNTSGSSVTQRRYQDSNYDLNATDIVCAGSNEIYFSASLGSFTTTITNGLVGRITSSLNTFTWLRTISYGTHGYVLSLASVPTSVLPGGGCYCAGLYRNFNNTGPFQMSVIYIDSSGTKQWGRYFSTSSESRATHAASNTTADAIICGYDSSSIWIITIPKNGSGQGNYTVGGQSISFQNDSSTLFSEFLSNNPTSISQTTLSGTSSAASNTISNASQTWNTTNI